MLDIIELPLDVVEAPDAKEIEVKGLVEYENVSFAYEEGRPVLQRIMDAARRLTQGR